MSSNKPLTEKRFVVLFGKLFNKHAQELGLATESFVESYVDGVAQEILKAVSDHDEKIDNRLNEMELKFVTRDEFEALKKQVTRLMAN